MKFDVRVSIVTWPKTSLSTTCEEQYCSTHINLTRITGNSLIRTPFERYSISKLPSVAKKRPSGVKTKTRAAKRLECSFFYRRGRNKALFSLTDERFRWWWRVHDSFTIVERWHEFLRRNFVGISRIFSLTVTCVRCSLCARNVTLKAWRTRIWRRTCIYTCHQDDKWLMLPPILVYPMPWRWESHWVLTVVLSLLMDTRINTGWLLMGCVWLLKFLFVVTHTWTLDRRVVDLTLHLLFLNSSQTASSMLVCLQNCIQWSCRQPVLVLAQQRKGCDSTTSNKSVWFWEWYNSKTVESIGRFRRIAEHIFVYVRQWSTTAVGRYISQFFQDDCVWVRTREKWGKAGSIKKRRFNKKKEVQQKNKMFFLTCFYVFRTRG